MLFNLERDTGSEVVGYVVPDGFTAQPMLSVHGHGVKLLTFRTNEHREALVAAGRHETGLCGFRIDEAMLPGLSAIADLSVHEAETNLLVYRRPQPRFIGRRLLRLETHLFPLWRLDNRLGEAFQYSETAVDRRGRETTTQMFLLNDVSSVYLSGRILFKNYAFYIDSVFDTFTILHDPYDELAERLIVLRNFEKIGVDRLGVREAVGLKPAIDFATSIPIGDEKGLRRALKRMPLEVASLLANPVVRQLTSTTPDEMPSGSSISAALDTLASFAIVGLRREPDLMQHSLTELLQIEAASIPALPNFKTVMALAEALKRSGAVEIMLEKDLELYSYVAAAFQRAS